MHIRILGTAAAEGWPALFCGCEACRRAREAGDKNIRTRASIQIDDNYKIDFPPDSHYHSFRYGLRFAELKYLFFTHSHGDHFAAKELEYLREGFSHDLAHAPIRVYAPPAVFRALEPVRERLNLPIRLERARPFSPIQADHLTFTPITASHAQTEECVNYIIESEDAAVLYTADTGVYDRATMDFISDFPFDLLIVECTFGATDAKPRAHMNLEAAAQLRTDLQKAGAIKPDARWVLTHFSHNMGMLHEEFERVAGAEGIEVAYDGMVIEL